MHGVGMPLMNNSPSLNFLRFFDGHGNFVPLIIGIKDCLMDILAQSISPKQALNIQSPECQTKVARVLDIFQI